MGLYSRDYMRDRPPSGAYLGAPRVTWWLIGINVLVWFVVTGSRSPFLLRTFVLQTDAVFGAGRVWQLLTATWIHDWNGATHLFWNMLLLYVFGRRAEALLGSRAFLRLYLLSGLASTILLAPWAAITGVHFVAFGASGAIFAVMVYVAFERPHETVMFFFVFPMPLWVAVALLVVGSEVLSLLALGMPTPTNVGHLCGAGYGWLEHRLIAPRLRRRTARPMPAPREPPAAEETGLARRVDALLAKIHDEGMDALTEEEKTFLTRASKRFR